MTKIVLVGAGSLQFGTGMLGDVFQSAHLTDAEIVLHDINLEAAQRTLKVSVTNSNSTASTAAKASAVAGRTVPFNERSSMGIGGPRAGFRHATRRQYSA